MVSERIGFFLRAIRQKLNLSQDKFGETLGISRDRIAKIELGIRRPDIDLLDDLRSEHNVSIDKLFDKSRKD